MAKINGEDLEQRKGEVPKRLETLEDWVKANMEQFRQRIQEALPGNVGYTNMASIALNILRADTNLQKCTPISFICAVLQSVQLNLEPNTPLGHCYIIPYWNSKIKRYEAQWQIGYKGLLEMGYRTNDIIEIDARKVFKGDMFDWQFGTEEFLKHKPIEKNWKYDDKTGLPIVTHYYAIFKTIRGVTKFVVWTKSQVEKHMSRFSPAAKKDAFSPWSTTPDLMSQKTVLRDLMRYAPLSPQDRRILESDETIKKEISPKMLDIPGTYEFDPDNLKGMDDDKFEGENQTQSESEGPERTETEGSEEKGKTEDVRPESGQDQARQPEENRADQENAGGEELDTRPITESQIGRLFAMGKDLGNVTEEQRKEFKDKIKAKFKLEHLNQMTRTQFNQANKELEGALKIKNNK